MNTPTGSTEAVGIGALVVALVNSVVQALNLFEIVTWTSDQVSVVNLVVVNLVVLASAVLTRRRVFSERTVERIDPAALNNHRAT